jgi:hypothetical protein
VSAGAEEAAGWAALNRPMMPWPQRAFTVGWDPAQAADWSAVAVVERARWPAEGADFSNIRVWASSYRVEYAVRHLERLPRRTDYVAQAQHVAGLMATAPLARPDTALVVDATGLGKPLVDLIRRAGLKPIAVTLTGGEGSRRDGAGGYRLSKTELTGRLSALLHGGELRIARELPLAPALADELRDFRVGFTAGGASTFGASAGRHDDLVLAVGLAVWWAAERARSGVSAIELPW